MADSDPWGKQSDVIEAAIEAADEREILGLDGGEGRRDLGLGSFEQRRGRLGNLDVGGGRAEAEFSRAEIVRLAGIDADILDLGGLEARCLVLEGRSPAPGSGGRTVALPCARMAAVAVACSPPAPRGLAPDCCGCLDFPYGRSASSAVTQRPC